MQSTRTKGKKLTADGARMEYVKAVAGAASNLHNIAEVQKQQEEMELEAMVRQAQAEVCGVCSKPFRKLEIVDQFEAQFGPDAKLKRRKILVLDGPSQYGKTEFAISLVPPGQGVEINCSNCTLEPPSQGMYRPTQHNLILCDEMKVSLLLKNKRLFQGPAVKVVLGSTQSNRFTYQALVFRKRFVIASNTWAKELKKCKKADRDWVTKNTFYVKVSEPLWVD